jgi:hypothetical protein
MSRFALLLACTMAAFLAGPASQQARSAPVDELYQSQTIVTGQGEANRQVGFRDCLDRVLVRVSGDPRLPSRPEMPALRDRAGSFVSSFRYHDRMEGIPVHDEQGTHDRPHDLTCLYSHDVIDKVLRSLGSRPWLGKRPRLAVFLVTEQGTRHFALTADENLGQAMRDSFTNAAGGLLMAVAFPTSSLLSVAGLDEQKLRDADPALLARIAEQAGADQALAGSIVWSDDELGWIANWRLATAAKSYKWQVRGVNFDEAFRVAARGAAQILSGNGQPD